MYSTIYNLISLGTLFSGLTIALLSCLAKNDNRQANLFLSLALTAALLKTSTLFLVAFPALGVSLYFYVRQSAWPQRPFLLKDLLHGCTLVACYWLPAWLNAVWAIVYLYLAYRLIQQFYGELKPVLMDRPRFTFRRLEKCLFLLSVLCLLAVFNGIFAFAIAFVLMGMAAGAVLQPTGVHPPDLRWTDRLTERELGRRIKELITANRFYEDPELTVATLAAKLKLSPHELSRAINLGLDKNFNDLINGFRVREVIRKMQDPANDRLTLLGIAYDTGFNSKTTFNRVFKELTGKTPAEYKTCLKKEVPFPKSAPRSALAPVILSPDIPVVRATEKTIHHFMLRNYLKTAFRNLLQNKTYAGINIVGLSIGLACAMLILLYIQDELSYDRFHDQVSRIYRIDKQTTKNDGSVSRGSYTGYFPGPRFAANIPEIKRFVRFQPAQADVKTDNDIRSQAVCFADTNFLSVFNFPLLGGDARTALRDPRSAVITEEMAKKYFGTSQALGKIILLKADSLFQPYVITGIARDCPQNSSIKFQVLLPLKVSATDEKNNGNWFNSFLSTFVVLAPGADLKAVETKMQKVFESDGSEAISEIKHKFKVKNIGISYFLEPLTAIHLGTAVPNENEALADKSDPEYTYILSAIALFVLAIACINFVNLTIARSVKRAKEIGIRKVIGGTKQQLRLQFLGESFMLCLVAFILAIVIVLVSLPVFNQLSNKVLALSYLFNIRLVSWYIILFLVTSLLAGIYPALVLSGYQPVQTLYSRFNLAGKNSLQKGLVVFQFALASLLIIGSMAIFLQFRYLTSERLGYDDRDLITVDKFPLSRSEAALFKEQLMKDPGIVAVAVRNGGYLNNTVSVNGGQQVNISAVTIDDAYLPLLHIPIAAGRNFSAQYPSDQKQAALVNEAFVKETGWAQPLGQQVNGFGNGGAYTVVGVVKDYHDKPLTEKIGPQLFTMNAADYGMLYIKIRPGTETASVRSIGRVFRELFPLSPFIYTFKQDQNAQNYAAEARWKAIIFYSALLTIFISCIGLFGLSVLAVEKRLKEIGVRKVLGAPATNIVAILSAEFLKLILAALVIALPVAWLATSRWLQHYPYRIALSWWLFAAGGLLVILVALFTISFQSVKAALADPVKSLRAE
ncbi:putative ABC transport system permease protein [Mucilaginibacter oryzae]|uniref:Putative ABC transport system permease protein n=1 Tax=Mucilaginibacter oryzae TaxID=468058 RepID=A0A316H0M7_9SPHI|nr:ABC transporter permease [Mucilaginibacter oryzae]PWK68290.1 putative ABC transport system permease protein [Mucilaginibacter oryzae]